MSEPTKRPLCFFIRTNGVTRMEVKFEAEDNVQAQLLLLAFLRGGSK